MELLESRGVLFPGRIVVDGKEAGVLAGPADRAREVGQRRDVHVIRDAEMPEDAGAAADGAMRADVALPAMPRSRRSPVVLPMRTCGPPARGCRSSRRPSITVSAPPPRRCRVSRRSPHVPMRTAPSCSIFSQEPAFGASRRRRRRSPRPDGGCSARRSRSSRTTVTRGLRWVPAPSGRRVSTTPQGPMRALVDHRIGIDHRARMDGGPRGRRGLLLPQPGEPRKYR